MSSFIESCNYDGIILSQAQGGNALGQSAFSIMASSMQAAISDCLFRNFLDTIDPNQYNTSIIPITNISYALSCDKYCTFPGASCVNGNCQYSPNLLDIFKPKIPNIFGLATSLCVNMFLVILLLIMLL